MVNPGDKITWAVLNDLATLANTKVPLGAPYVFPPFAGIDQLSVPDDVKPVATYGTGSFGDGQKVTLWLFSYRTIAGLKTYSWTPLLKAFVGASGSGNFSLTWTWTSPTDSNAPEGYLAVIPTPVVGEWAYTWKDIGNVQTLTQDGTFAGWLTDSSLNDNGASNVPCAHGVWLKILNRIHSFLFVDLSLYGGPVPFTSDFVLSGPWCVSVAPKLYLTLNGFTVYDNVEFWYNEEDSVTGNEIASEADMLNTYFGAVNNDNNLNFNVNGTLNGSIILMSLPPGQLESDWSFSSVPTAGITITFIPNYVDVHFGRTVTAIKFDLVDVPYVVGTPIILTANPPPLNSIILDGTGGLINVVFTGDKVTYTPTDGLAIHPAGATCKIVSLDEELDGTTFTIPTGGTGGNIVFACHYRTFCNGVFTANTLPTMGMMTYLDVDLPQYRPSSFPPASSRRVNLNNALAATATVDNRGALYLAFKDSDFTPDSVAGLPLFGSKAWQQSIFSKGITTRQLDDDIPPGGVAQTLYNYLSVLIPDGATDLRVLAINPALTIYVKKGSFPTVSSFDGSAPGGTWLDIPTVAPGDSWFISALNPTPSVITGNLTSYVLTLDDELPNGSFFPIGTDGLPQIEGYSYSFWNDVYLGNYPIPQFGYCVYSLTIERQPVDNGSGVSISPSTGISALIVHVGVSGGFGYATAGTFEELVAITIPAGRASITQACFFPVLGGAPIRIQCDELVVLRAAVNFQPSMHSQFGVTTSPQGAWNGIPWYNRDSAMLTFQGGNPQLPITLSLGSAVLNDLTAALNLMP